MTARAKLRLRHVQPQGDRAEKRLLRDYATLFGKDCFSFLYFPAAYALAHAGVTRRSPLRSPAHQARGETPSLAAERPSYRFSVA